jgi:hypothetical protein
MKNTTQFTRLKPTTLSSLMALALAGSSWATSPYDTAYGVQWSFLIGNSGGDVPNALAVSPDGTVWIATGGTGSGITSPMLTWGSPKSVWGGVSASGYGQISRLGGILQCNDIPNVTGVSAFSQAPAPTIAFSGTNPTAYFGCQPNSALLWTNASPADTSSATGQPMTFAIGSVLGQTGYEPYGAYVNAAGQIPLNTTLPRKNDPLDATKKFTHDMVSPTSYGGANFDFKVGSDGSYYIARGAQGPGAGQPLTMGDSFTAGDFSGPVNMSYKPCVGRISADGLTKSGPAHQPECNGRSFFTDIAINESANAGAGRVYATGLGLTSSGGTMNSLDPDGPGTDFAPIAFNSASTNNNKGFALVYNATTWAIDKVVTWESTYGGDIPKDITSTASGGFVLVGQTLGGLGGFTNPTPGTNDGYIEVYDASGTLSWKFQTQTTVADFFEDASVDADGSIYVSGNSNGNPVLWKFTAGGTLVWTSTIDNSGTVESQRDHGGDKNSIFYLSSHNRTGGTGTWPNTIAYVPQGNDDNLLQKLIPGDFNLDKFVNFTDVQIAGTATKPGLPGNNTYDFNGDGDSTLADTTYMITNIMDRLVGDIAQDTLATDVDNADIGRAIGASGVGTLYLDGDIDFDADVDPADITAVATAFTGAKKPGTWTNGTPGATLRYVASNGQVWLKADEASGGIITSFQLENAAGTFVPANFTGPAGGSFGGSLKDITGNVLADTDLTLAGSSGTSGLISLGTVFPTGMDLAGLTAYLKTAVYTGQPCSGQMQFTPVVYNPVEPPNVLTLTPDGVDSVLVSSDLVATFDEPVVLTGSGTVTLRNLTLGTGSDIVIALPDSQVSITGTTLTINPAAPLAVATDYAVQISSDAIKDVDDNSNFAGILDDTTWTFSTADHTPPTLAGTSIVDNKSGGPIAPNTPVTYTVTFNEDMDASTVDAADFGNAGTATVTIGTITETTPGVFTVEVTPTTGGTLQLQVIAGAVITDTAANPLNTTAAIPDNTTITVDGNPPALIGSDIVDNKSGGPVQVYTLVTYTVTFSKDMDATTVSSADFGNAVAVIDGGASFSIGTVTETAPGVFLVPATPTSTGTLQLQVNALAELKDALGNALNTSSAIVDDTPITVTPDITAPAPDPMTWATVPTATGQTAITMTATTATDPSGVQYSFECTAGGGHSSGWQSSPTYTDTGLSVETTYSYRVQARDMSPAQNMTGFSATASATTAGAATMSASPTAPVVNDQDIANYGAVTGSDKWWASEPGASEAKGQTFTTGGTPVLLKAITYQALHTTPDKTYIIRVGTVSGTTFSQFRSFAATQSFAWNDQDYITWTFATPVLLAPNTVYGLDVGMTSTTSPWQDGIPYLNVTGNTYAGGVRYGSGENGLGTSTLNLTAGDDRVFHLDIGNPTAGYADWSGGAAADIDNNGDGVENGVAWALGAADPNANAIGLLPALDNTTDPAYLLFTFNRSDEANDDPNTAITVEYGNDLVGWTTAVDNNDNVEIEVTDGTPTDAVVVKLKRSTLGATGRIFARLRVVVTTP